MRNKADGDRAIDEDSSPDWRVFKHDTEAGRLLSRLYGVRPNARPQIKYPNLKTREICGSAQQRSHWKSPGQGQQVERKGFDRSRAASVTAPKVGRAAQDKPASAVTLIPRRKNEVACQEEQLAIESVRHTFRPPNRGDYSTDREKDRLNELFTFGGGSALPEELTLPQAPLPSEVRQKKEERRRVEKACRRRRAQRNGGGSNGNGPDLLDGNSSQSDNDEGGREALKDGRGGHKAGLFDQILGEIEERRNFQFAMEEAGSGTSTRAQIADEISSRVKELAKLDKGRASRIIQGF